MSLLQVGCSKLKYQRLAVAPSQRRFAQAHAIVCCGASIVAHFARKVRGTNIVAAKHELKIQQSHAPELWSCSLRVRDPHFASKVSYNAGAATDDYAAQISAARAILHQYLYSILNTLK